ncbi:MAG TPA: Sec-independent protein translocase protein TatB [Acidimicrobiales bacterium]|nr:Sec-independent protein translocase protein TatB [Acidimicrobiales bacterium]
MGSIGPAEILVVLIVALIVLGPARLPEAARTVGKAVSELRRATAGLQSEVREAFSEAQPVYPTTRMDEPAPADQAQADRPEG